MPPVFDKSYEPRWWRCDECRRVLGVVMRDVDKVRRLWIFQVDRSDGDVPRPSTLWTCPRGLFKSHGVDSCHGVECSICGALTGWTPSRESFDVLMSHYAKRQEPKVVV